MKNRVEKFEKCGIKHGYIYENGRIILGLSGGVDSMAMTLMFLELRQRYALFLIVAHINYHLRGEESDSDERFVKEFCFAQNLPLYILNAQQIAKQNLQKKARDIRLDFFRKLKKHYKMDFIALAHHSDDQCETVLHRFIRGAGFTGLGGMRYVKGDIVHPLLQFTKADLQAYLSEKDVPFRTDHTNRENDYTRNKIRNELLPHIKQHYNPNIEQKLVEYSHLFAHADDYFVGIAQKELKKVLIDRTYSDVVLDLERLRKCHPIVLYYLLHEVWSDVAGTDKNFYLVHFDDIVKAVNSETGYKELTLPEQVKVLKDYGTLIFRQTRRYIEPTKEPIKEIVYPKGTYTAGDLRFTLEAKKVINDELNTPNSVILDLDKIVFPIVLRNRTAGDKFIPNGMTNFKKLKDFFIDAKVSMMDRDNVLLWTDTEKIIWVCGHRIDQRVAVTPDTKNFLYIKTERIETQKSRSLKRKG